MDDFVAATHMLRAPLISTGGTTHQRLPGCGRDLFLNNPERGDSGVDECRMRLLVQMRAPKHVRLYQSAIGQGQSRFRTGFQQVSDDREQAAFRQM